MLTKQYPHLGTPRVHRPPAGAMMGNASHPKSQQVAVGRLSWLWAACRRLVAEWRADWRAFLVEDISGHRLGCDCPDCPQGEAWCGDCRAEGPER